MEENKNRQNTDENRKTMGLSLSDTAYYDVNVSEPEAKDADSGTAPAEKGKSRGFVLPFVFGFALCALLMLAAAGPLGLGKFITRAEYDYYHE